MSKFCPACGEELVDNARFCKNCGKELQGFKTSGPDPVQPPAVEKDHTLAIVLGFIAGALIPLIGIIFAVYLVTRNDSAKAKQYGKYLFIFSGVMFLVWSIINW